MIAYLFLLLGLLLLFLEFYTPGGLFAVAAIAVLLIGIVTFVTENSPAASIFFVVLTSVGVVITVKLALKRIQKSGSQNTFYLSKDQEGYQATQYDRTQIGKEGISLSDLGPSGYIVVEGKRFAATAKSGYLDKGTKVQVIGGEGSQLIVKAVL
jgi:membrane-bound ClpP family serine protease